MTTAERVAEEYMRTLWRLFPGEDSPVPDPDDDPEGWASDRRIFASRFRTRAWIEAEIEALQAALALDIKERP